MVWQKVTIGGLELRETWSAEQNGGELRIGGQESHPPSTKAAVEAAHLNLGAMQGLFLPVVFGDKVGLTGFYRVGEARSALTRMHGGSYQVADWQVQLLRVGNARDIELESLVPLIPRVDELAGTQTPVYWHAPAIGSTSYLTGAAVPGSFVDRPGSDGIIRVYTGLPDDSPRWTVRADDYLRGAARLYFDGFRRLGLVTPSAAVWELHNSLVQVTPGAAGSLTVSTWDNAAWRSATRFLFNVGGVPVTAAPELTIIRNEPEQVILRLTYPVTGSGRLQVDLGLRRGSRVVTGVLKRHGATLLEVAADSGAAFTTSAGLLHQTTADGDGNRYVMGSSRNVTFSGAAPGAMSYTGTRLDFFLGHQAGDPPAVGDAASDLLAQYLMAGGEEARVIRR
jgi:hypothetical protein